MLMRRAPDFRRASIMARELVPRTRLSSMTTTCRSWIISRMGIIHRFISTRSLCCGSMKLLSGPFLL